MSRYRRQIGHSDPERETSGLAGWMYTDLLLGLAVVFLGSIGVALLGTGTGGSQGASKPDDQSLGTQTEQTIDPTTTTSTSTSTTMPGMPIEELEICPVLYLPSEDSDDGFKITIPGRLNVDTLAETFRSEMGQRLAAENRKLPPGAPPFRFDDMDIALAIIFYGPTGENDREISRQAFEVLANSFPRQFERAVVRPGIITSGNPYTSIEILLLIDRPCTAPS